MKTREGIIKEMWVTVRPDNACLPGSDEFREIWLPLQNTEVAKTLSQSQRNLPPSIIIPVNLNATQWMHNVTTALKKGFHLIFDYGYSGSQYPEDKLIYTINRTIPGFVGTALWEAGDSDVTSWVDFDHLRYIGEAAGASTTLAGWEGEFFAPLSWKHPNKHQGISCDGKKGFLCLLQEKI